MSTRMRMNTFGDECGRCSPRLLGETLQEIPGFEGVWADAVSLEDRRDELEEVLEEWLLFRLSRQLPVPILDGMDLVVREVA